MFSLLLNPIAQGLFVVAQLYFLASLNVVYRIVVAAIFVISYILLTPNTKRGSWMWSAGPVEAPKLLDREIFNVRGSPLLIVSYSLPSSGGPRNSWEHALSFRHKTFSKAVVMVSGPELVLKFPLARFLLWLVGGLVPYTRGTLLHLLKRKTVNPNQVIVVSQNLSGSTIQLKNKGAFAAALKTGAAIIPALMLPDGSVALGPATSRTAQGAVPTIEEIIELATLHAAQLRELATKHQVSLEVTV
jgi:hypothetical protein